MMPCENCSAILSMKSRGRHKKSCLQMEGRAMFFMTKIERKKRRADDLPNDQSSIYYATAWIHQSPKGA